MAKVAVYYPIMSPPVERALQTVDDWELACEQALGWAKDSSSEVGDAYAYEWTRRAVRTARTLFPDLGL